MCIPKKSGAFVSYTSTIMKLFKTWVIKASWEQLERVNYILKMRATSLVCAWSLDYSSVITFSRTPRGRCGQTQGTTSLSQTGPRSDCMDAVVVGLVRSPCKMHTNAVVCKRKAGYRSGFFFYICTWFTISIAEKYYLYLLHYLFYRLKKTKFWC